MVHQSTAWTRAHTFDSLLHADVLLTSAFYEQFHSIGWYYACLGHISKKWANMEYAYQNYSNGTLEYWASLLIDQLWQFTLSHWTH
jgi:hypothetical protein